MQTTTSPFKYLREATGLSNIEFVREAAIAKTSGVYLEAGLMLMPRATLVLENLLIDREIPWAEMLHDTYGQYNLESATTLWQREVRKTHSFAIQEAFAIWTQENSGLDVDPLTEFIGYAFENRDQFCKAMKVQTGPIKLYLESTRSMPKLLVTALLDAGLQQNEIEELAEEITEWKTKQGFYA